MRNYFVALIFSFLSTSSLAQSPCNLDPSQSNTEACAIETSMAAEGPMNDMLQEVVDELDVIAKINHNFANSTKILMESQFFWQQYRIKDCDVRASAYPETKKQSTAFMNCFGNHALERTAELRSYLASLAPYSPTPQQRIALEEKFVCDITGIEKGPATPKDRCFMRAAAKRCNKSDDCMIQCLKGGGGQSIAGGCYHICWRVDPKHPSESENPPGSQACSIK